MIPVTTRTKQDGDVIVVWFGHGLRRHRVRLRKNCDLILELLVAVGEFVLLRTATNTYIPCSGCNMCYHALTTIGMDKIKTGTVSSVTNQEWRPKPKQSEPTNPEPNISHVQQSLALNARDKSSAATRMEKHVPNRTTKEASSHNRFSVLSSLSEGE
ncbi:hypothetical protein F2Q70_00039404 [Brassica cretica]|uniref:Uncharacterized protein n=1 Tax=Brassica cretica TaxID=69181 RepID=A0A8S9K886_BRACR|nr:hypothetical protein F2Q70_00039404 [Brassica cretica]KAF2619664.1 hypothetical protein F2Q68_00040104 [Brassica cretica]